MINHNAASRRSSSVLPALAMGFLLQGLSSAATGWSGTAAGGLTITDGNSETSVFNAAAEAVKVWDIHSLTVGGDVLVGEVGDVTTNELFHGYVDYKRTLEDPWYAGATGDLLHDDLAQLDYRLGIYPYLGYKVIDNGRMLLTFEGGPGYVFEKTQDGFDSSGYLAANPDVARTGWRGTAEEHYNAATDLGQDRGDWNPKTTSSDYAALRLAERLEYQLNDRTKLWQSLEWIAALEDFDNALIVAEFGIDTKISDKWSIRALVRSRFDGEVPAGVDDNDITFISALAYGFGGDEIGEIEEKTSADLAAAREDLEIGNEWVTTGLAGLTIAEGNSESLLATANVHTAREWDGQSLAAQGGLVIGELSGETSAQVITGGLAYTRDLSDPWFFAAGADFLHDDLADLDYRLSVWPALGAVLFDDGVTTFTVQAGPAYVFEKSKDAFDESGYLATWPDVAAAVDAGTLPSGEVHYNAVNGIEARGDWTPKKSAKDYVAARAMARLDHQMNDNIALHGQAEWLAELDDFDNSIVTLEAGAAVDMGAGLTFNVLLQSITDNEPGAGLEETDTRFVSAIGYEF